MHEDEKDTAEIDVIAAGINHDAARVVRLAEARARSARTRQGFAEYSGVTTGSDEPTAEEAIAPLAQEEAIAQQMASQAEQVRDGAAELQRLAHEMRGHLAGAQT